ncbi:MAG: DUF3011 domain-containing protein [Parvibaculaceae bacterium]|nr:DUF3011 domain-containing protein [Parvibaculaceae bacterium]
MFAFRQLTTIGLAIGAMIAGLVAFQSEAKAFEVPENWRGGLQSYGWDNNPYSRGNRYDLVCTSNHYRNQTCRLPRGVNGHIKLIKKISSAPCVLGQTWGVGERSVWVSDGCRAVFRLGEGRGNGRDGNGGRGGRGGDDGPYHHAQKRQMSCGSSHGNYHECHLRHAKRRHVKLARQVSFAPCDRGHTWGVKKNKIWVKDGCRAVFKFNGKRPHYWSPSE